MPTSVLRLGRSHELVETMTFPTYRWSRSRRPGIAASLPGGRTANGLCCPVLTWLRSRRGSRC